MPAAKPPPMPITPEVAAAAKEARAAALVEENSEDNKATLPAPQALLHWHAANLEYANGTQLYSLSNRWWDADDEFDFHGTHYLLPDGYGGLLEKVAGGLDIRYKHEVTSVTKTATGGVRVGFKAAGHKADGRNPSTMVPTAEAAETEVSTIDADAVVCTLPLGVLKHGGVTFDPPIAERKQDAIERLGFGALNKVLLTFAEPFWAGVEGTRDFFGVCAPSSSRRGEAFQFWNLHRCTGEPMLLALHAGRAAFREEDGDGWEAAAIEATMGYLKTIFGAANVPAPVHTRVTRWHEDPYARGVYSHVALGATPRDYDTMAEPLWNGTLMFAGEHTCRHHPATVAGALISGVREAGRFQCQAIGKAMAAAKMQGPPPVLPPPQVARPPPQPAAVVKPPVPAVVPPQPVLPPAVVPPVATAPPSSEAPKTEEELPEAID